jgi:hypothetical protein
MIREDREPLAELAQLNNAMAPTAMRVMTASTSVAERQNYALRLIAAGERLQRRVDGTAQVVKGEVLVNTPPALSTRTREA